MGFFSSWFRKPVVIEDEFFGRLTLEPGGHSASGYCFLAQKVWFSPTGAAIECSINSDSSGPTPSQRAFFRHVAERYVDLLPKISAQVEAELRQLKLDYALTNFESTYSLAGMTIPQLNTSPVEWELWFELLDVSTWGYTLTVSMLDDAPQGIGISC